MFSETADLYDLIYRSVKDYRVEAAAVAALIRRHDSDASRLLDVACGTGEHAYYLCEDHGFRVDGVDLDPRLVEQARAKIPAGEFHRADMAEFDLGRKYDAVLCLFGSVGYVVELARLRRALAVMGAHVAAGGLLIVEPWFEPGTMEDGHVTCMTASGEGITVCRMSRTEIVERRSRLWFEYLVGTPTELRRASEVHELGLFARAEMEQAFRSAGCEPHFDPEGIAGRGLYVARRAS